MWVQKLSPAIKASISSYKFNHTTYNDVFDVADKTWLAHGGAAQPAVVAATSTAEPSDPPSSDTPQVAAVASRGGRGRGNSNSNSYNNNSNSSDSSATNASTSTNSSNKPHQKGPKHADLPSNAGWACAQHWKKGRSAAYCSDPLTCQWVNVIAPRT